MREITERNLEAAIGREVRTFRRQQGMTVADLAAVTGLSIGMLSKIENGNTSPSLTTLQVLSHAFSVPVTAFFKSYEERRDAQHVKSGEHIEIERRGTRAGHQYNLLGHIGSNSSGVVVEPYIITLTTESDTFPAFQHEGLELLYMLEGEVDYRHGDQVYALKPGDSLFFDADAPHGPEVLVKLPARYLSVICYPQEGVRRRVNGGRKRRSCKVACVRQHEDAHLADAGRQVSSFRLAFVFHSSSGAGHRRAIYHDPRSLRVIVGSCRQSGKRERAHRPWSQTGQRSAPRRPEPPSPRRTARRTACRQRTRPARRS